MCGTVDRMTGVTDAKKKARREKARIERERAAAEAELRKQRQAAEAELAKQEELVDAKEAYEAQKKKERTRRLSQRGGGLSTKYKGTGLGGQKDTLG